MLSFIKALITTYRQLNKASDKYIEAQINANLQFQKKSENLEFFVNSLELTQEEITHQTQVKTQIQDLWGLICNLVKLSNSRRVQFLKNSELHFCQLESYELTSLIDNELLKDKYVDINDKGDWCQDLGLKITLDSEKKIGEKLSSLFDSIN